MSKKIQIIIAFVCGVLVGVGFILVKDWFLKNYQVTPKEKAVTVVEEVVSRSVPTSKEAESSKKAVDVQKIQKNFFKTKKITEQNQIEIFNQYQKLFKYYLQQNSLEGAEKTLRHAAKLFPNEKLIYKDIGYLESTKGNLEIAANYLEEALNKNESFLDGQEVLDTNIYNNLGNVYANLNQYKKAEEALQSAIKMDPNYAPAYYTLGSLYLTQKKEKKAKEAYMKGFALDMDPATPFDYFDMAYLLKGKKEKNDAIRLLKVGMERYPTATGFNGNLAGILYDKKVLNEAHYHLLIEGLLSNEDNPYMKQVTELVPQISQEVIKKKGKKFPDLYYFLMGQSFFHSGKLEKAEAAFRKALSFDPRTKTIINLYLAEALAAQNKFDQSRKQYSEVIAEAPYLASAYMELAQVEEAAGNKTKAKQLRLKAKKINSQNWMVLEYFGKGK